MMLRSAEADPHVIERVQLPRRRGVAWATRAVSPQPPPAPKCQPWPGSRATAGAGPPWQSSRALGAARRRSAGKPRSRGRETPRGWLHPPKREEPGLVERFTEQPTSGLCSTDESVVSHPPLPAEQHSFLPWALFPFKAPSHSAPIRPCQADGKPLLPNRSSTSAEPARAVCLRRTASSRRAIEIPSRVPPLYRAEARCWGAAGGPKPSPTAAPFQRDRGTPVGASCCPPSTEAEDERWDSAREVCPESEVVTPLVCNASDTLGVTRGRRPL